MDKQPVGGETPDTAPAEATIPVTAPVAETSSLQQQEKQNFTARVMDANSPNAIRALVEEAKRNGLKAPKQDSEPKPAEGNPAAEIPPDLKALETEGKTPADSAETPPEEVPAENAPDPDGDDADGDDAEGDVTPSQAKKLRLRLPEDDKVGRLAAAFMQRNRDMTMESAMEKAREKLGIKPKDAPADTPQAPKSDLPESVEEVDTTLNTLDADREKAMVELRFEDVAKIDRQIRKLDRHRTTLERQAEQSQIEATRNYRQSFRASEAKATDLYAFAADPNSPGGKRMKEIDETFEEMGDPRFNDPNKPLIIANLVAAELNIAPRRKGTPAAPAKPASPAAPVPAAPKKGVVPSGASRTVPATGTQKTAIDAKVSSARSILDIRNIRRELGLPI